MLIRNTQGQVEAAAKDDLDKTKYTWHVYTSARGTRFNGTKGTASLKKGDYFGVKEFTSKDDKVLMLNENLVFKLAIDKSDKLMNEKGKECRGGKLPKGAVKVEPPKKIKINVDEKPTAKPKAPKANAEAKPAKVKPTANQKAIDKLKAEIKRIKGLTQNNANLRKIAKLKEELKKKQAKETATPKAVATPKEAKAPKAKVKKTDITFSKKGSKIEALLNGKVVVTGYLLSDGRYNVDYKFIGGKQAKIDGPLSNVKEKMKARIEKYVASTTVGDKVEAPARVKETAAPVNPVKEVKKAEAKKVKITVTPSDDDDDDAAVPHGHVRYGGKLIEPDELEFDDDVRGLVDLPIDQSWSSNNEEKPDAEITIDSHDAQFVSRRPH